VKYCLLYLCCVFIVLPANAQLADSAIVATIDSNNRIQFSAKLPKLTQIPGAPEPFYTYLWDFGDGHFSTSKSPSHYYAIAKTYDVNFYAVNNYDDGKKPQRKKQQIKIAKQPLPKNIASVSPSEKDFFKANGRFELKYNCMAKPDDTMVLIVGWKNDGPQNIDGKLYLLMNEKIFDQTCFDTSGLRFFNNEALMASADIQQPQTRSEPLVITESGSPPSNSKKMVIADDASTTIANTFSSYRNIYSASLGTIPSGETRFSFLQLYVTPQMIKDTNATLTITGMFVPDKGSPVMHKLSVPVVNSHDPNKMNLKGGRISYRFLKKNKSLQYKVRFQNNGKGPARKISLNMDLAAELDPQTIQVKDMSPLCPPCDSLAKVKQGCWELEKKDSRAIFTFHGIYLSGTNQKGVEDKDSTKGFMEFGITTKKKLENRPFKSRTAIYFDKNEPVITNFATGRFKKSPSPILMAGYEKAFGNNAQTSDGIVTGIGLAPLAPYRPYLQMEIFYKAGIRTTTVNLTNLEKKGTVYIDSLKRFYEYSSLDSTQTIQINQIKLIPLQLRHNLNKFISIGVGAVVSADIGGKMASKTSYHLLPINGQTGQSVIKNATKQIKSFSNWKASPFLDLQVGLVKLGPHLGFRYYYNAKSSSFGYLYAGWRF